MTSDTYIVLSDLDHAATAGEADRAVRVDSPLGRTKSLGRTIREIGTSALERSSRRAGEFGVQIRTATGDELPEARRDERTSAVAVSMATALVRPLAAEGASEDQPGPCWGISKIGADASERTGEGVTVAVLDTGIDRTHACFDGVEIVEEDFTGEGNGDRNGHGTHCCGTIFGRSVEGKRIGVAPGIRKALIGKVLRSDGSGSTDMLFRALAWAVDSNADVVSMSLGFDFPGYVKSMVDDGWAVEPATSKALVAFRDNLRLFDNLMQRIRLLSPFDRGAVVVAAAGNESKLDGEHAYRIAASLPAAADGIVSVGALKREVDGLLSVAAFSNSTPRVTAPGVDVVSAASGTKNQLVGLSGTSMACPHVAGVAALWWESLRKADDQEPTAAKVENRLIGNVRTDVFLHGVAPLDRGDGMVVAPIR